jgi:hypothetical protein
MRSVHEIDAEAPLEIDSHRPLPTKGLKRLHPAAWWEVLEELLHAVGERRCPFYVNYPLAGLELVQH